MSRLNTKDLSPRERFLRVAALRTSRVIDALESLGRCSNSVQYEYNSGEVQQMFKAIQAEIDHARERFANNGETTTRTRFAFSSE